MPPIDPNLMKDCEHARQALGEAEEAVVAARAGFERSVRRLYVEGASTREIAAVLGLSHQRVHQMIGATPKNWLQRVLGLSEPPDRGCSFCGKDAGSVGRLVGGLGVHICDGCIAEADRVLGKAPVNSNALPAGNTVMRALPVDSPKRCSFCGSRKRGLARASWGDHQICSACRAMAAEIAAKAPV